MFLNFVDELRAAGISASLKEHLTLLEALDKDVIEQTPEAFYYLSRATFVKDEGRLQDIELDGHGAYRYLRPVVRAETPAPARPAPPCLRARAFPPMGRYGGNSP